MRPPRRPLLRWLAIAFTGYGALSALAALLFGFSAEAPLLRGGVFPAAMGLGFALLSGAGCLLLLLRSPLAWLPVALSVLPLLGIYAIAAVEAANPIPVLLVGTIFAALQGAIARHARQHTEKEPRHDR